jgi:hypothetical protein
MRMVASFLLCSAVLIPAAASATPPAPTAAPASLSAIQLEKGEGRTLAAKLAQELKGSFVYPDQAAAYAAMLDRNAAAGRYDSGTRGELAKRINEDLMAVHKDGHLTVNVTEPRPSETGAAGGGGGGAELPPLIQSARTIAPGIGYIRFSAFFGTDEEMAGVRKWLADNRKAKTLIIDLRNHHGGGLAEQDAIFASIYASETPLVRMEMAKAIYDKYGSPMGNAPSLKFAAQGDKMIATHTALPGEDTPLRKAKVYLLVSNKSASAAEHFALALKSSGRATLIGEATAGANHFGGPTEITDHFNVWMPVGRTYDIHTGKDWEGTGVAPDISVDPKDALVAALEKAGVSHAEAVRLDAEEVPAEPIHADKVRAR